MIRTVCALAITVGLAACAQSPAKEPISLIDGLRETPPVSQSTIGLPDIIGKKMQANLLTALDEGAIGEPYEWQEGSYQQSITVVRSPGRLGIKCRSFIREIRTEAETVKYDGFACKNPQTHIWKFRY